MFVKLFLFFLTIGTSIILYRYKIEDGELNVLDYNLQDPPRLIGPLEENNLLRGGDWLMKGEILGGESLVIDNGSIYTGTADGKIVKITNGEITDMIKVNPNAKNCNGGRNTLECGRPLGIRKLKTNEFIVADPSKGVYTVNFDTRELKIVFDVSTKVNNKYARFLDDLTIYNENEIFVTDASTKYGYDDVLKVFFEHQPRGRILRINIKTGKASEEATGFYFPNGIQMHPDGDSIVVCDFNSANIWRYYVNGKKKNEAKIFIDNLPGNPDNIRLSKSGKSFYVALGSKRSFEKPSIIDKLNNGFIARHLRGIIATNISPHLLLDLHLLMPHPGSLFLELDLEGNIIKSFHDNEGVTVSGLTEVAEDDKYFYFGSFNANYLTRVPKRTTPIM
uniref:Str_synth domain-containing protein n=1 Tax=Parastrongyloides trichosuri TaxID=131310 RepID=A0A0N4Z335_PARTI